MSFKMMFFTIEMSQDRVVIPHHDPEWPARSPDLTPCDFFLWGYMKGKVFSTTPATIEELRERIVREFDLLKKKARYGAKCSASHGVTRQFMYRKGRAARRRTCCTIKTCK